ncbi:hypothetical protein E2C06_00195 [Dankookia rubra]|uniref:Uncharacterized protein n=1 Tax=Dankookia rubra TaxID=1442381 RepID=A0A4R5QLK8_9PROT|nr:hypothetical protein [Dankookia rubra]TDH64404.1 hypothetical protein E2C06_00195 [Dankookia rubra]
MGKPGASAGSDQLIGDLRGLVGDVLRVATTVLVQAPAVRAAGPGAAMPAGGLGAADARRLPALRRNLSNPLLAAAPRHLPVSGRRRRRDGSSDLVLAGFAPRHLTPGAIGVLTPVCGVLAGALLLGKALGGSVLGRDGAGYP